LDAFLQRRYFYFVRQGVTCRAWVNDEQLIEPQILECRSHGGCIARGIRSLDFDAYPPASVKQEKIKLRTRLGSPIVGLRVVEPMEQLLHDESLPVCADLRVAFQSASVAYAQ